MRYLERIGGHIRTVTMCVFVSGNSITPMIIRISSHKDVYKQIRECCVILLVPKAAGSCNNFSMNGSTFFTINPPNPMLLVGNTSRISLSKSMFLSSLRLS